MDNNSPLDRFDRAILAILQSDNTTPQRTIGRDIGLSAPAVQRRIKKMQGNGVINANIAVVNPAHVGQQITIVVEIEVISETIHLLDAIKHQFQSASEVQQCYYVTGDADFVMIVVVPTMADYESFTRRYFFSNANIKKFKSFVVMDRVKVGLAIDLGSKT
jgi:Lrp/AsnC family transcriptional regulator, leucine-responsive regulatory protein